eukprot:1161897-Pelagomonas_calceolata.AAC.4
MCVSLPERLCCLSSLPHESKQEGCCRQTFACFSCWRAIDQTHETQAQNATSGPLTLKAPCEYMVVAVAYKA